LQLVEERAPNGFDRIDDVVSPQDLQAIAASFSSAAGLDIETVNSRPPYLKP
jgi:5-methylphenazine-1-carboxylate 1-monooxygenase